MALANDRAARQRVRENAQVIERNRRAWAERHPAIAREEVDLRKYNRSVRKDFGHKVNGTPETHAKFAAVREGALARLHASGDIDVHQLAAAVSISQVYAKITRPVAVGTVSYETRVDESRLSGQRSAEKIGAVRAELTYSKWRDKLAHPAAVLAMVVHDVGLTRVAAEFQMRNTKAKKLLIDALDLWMNINDSFGRKDRPGRN